MLSPPMLDTIQEESCFDFFDRDSLTTPPSSPPQFANRFSNHHHNNKAGAIGDTCSNDMNMTNTFTTISCDSDSDHHTSPSRTPSPPPTFARRAFQHINTFHSNTNSDNSNPHLHQHQHTNNGGVVSHKNSDHTNANNNLNPFLVSTPPPNSISTTMPQLKFDYGFKNSSKRAKPRTDTSHFRPNEKRRRKSLVDITNSHHQQLTDYQHPNCINLTHKQPQRNNHQSLRSTNEISGFNFHLDQPLSSNCNGNHRQEFNFSHDKHELYVLNMDVNDNDDPVRSPSQLFPTPPTIKSQASLTTPHSFFSTMDQSSTSQFSW